MTAEARQAKTLTLLSQATPLQLFAKIAQGRFAFYAIGFFAVVLTSASEVMIPKLMQYGIDILIAKVPMDASTGFVSLLGSAPSTALGRIVAMMGLLMCIGALGRFGWRQFLARQTHEVGNALKVGLWDVLRKQPMHTFRRYSLGDLMNRSIGDWQASRVIFGFTLVLALDVILFTSFALIAMLLVDVPLTLMTLSGFLLASPVVAKLAQKEHDQHEKAQEDLSELSIAITQSIRSIRFQRATHSEFSWQTELQRLSDIYRAARLKVIETAWKIFPWSSAPTLVAYAILATVGVSRVADGTITPGQLVALCSFVLLMQTPLMELGDCIAELQKGFASLRRMQEVLNLPRGKQHLKSLSTPDQTANVESGDEQIALRLEQVTFAYPDCQPVLRDLNLTVAAGSITGIIGPIGSGKTSFLQLIAGLEPPLRGDITIFGRPYRDIPRARFARIMTVVPQTAFLFAGSIRQNLSLDRGYSNEELWTVLEAVSIRTEVEQMPQGLDTSIGEWGINLSGGQKQRLALARALLRKRPLLLLDDCLSAVDSMTEEMILQHILQVPNQTVIWAAHRPSTLRHCQKILRFENGTLIDVTRAIREGQG